MSEQEKDATSTGDWEMVDSTNSAIREFRQRVVGGWLVVCSLDESTGLVFLPDPNGDWSPPIKQSRKKGGFY